jgi:hypothetical protein
MSSLKPALLQAGHAWPPPSTQTPVDDGDVVGECEQEIHVVLDDDDCKDALQLAHQVGKPSAPVAAGSTASSTASLAEEPALAALPVRG